MYHLDMKSLTLLEWKLLQWMATPFNKGTAYHCFHVHPSRKKPYFHEDFVKGTENAAVTFIKRGWVSADEYQNHRLNEAGLAAAKSEPRPQWKPPNPPPLEKRDTEVLRELAAFNRDHPWATPMWCGGRNGSHHSASLTKLTHHGLAECRKFGKVVTGDEIFPEPSLTKRAKGSRVFRITAKGKRFLNRLQDATLKSRRQSTA